MKFLMLKDDIRAEGLTCVWLRLPNANGWGFAYNQKKGRQNTNVTENLFLCLNT